MKRMKSFALGMLLAALPVAAASITVKSPAAGDNWTITVASPIAWTYKGLPDSTKILLVLFHNGAKLGVIADNLAIGSNGNGSYNWSVGTYTGGPAVAGTGYSIKVRTSDNSVSAFSGSFSLSVKSGNTGGNLPVIGQPLKDLLGSGRPCMTITSPKAGDIVDPYNTVYVKWTHLAGLDANVSVQLLRSGKGRMMPIMLAASTPNAGIFSWDVISMAPAPGIYAIKVRTLDGKCEAVSGNFTMKEAGGIELLSPKGGEIFENGTSHAVTWKRQGNVQTVDIELTRLANGHTHAIAQGVDAKLGSWACVFDRDSMDHPGDTCQYKLFINHSAGGSSNISNCFTITGNPDLAITLVDYPGVFNQGADLTLTVKVENKGEVASHPCQGDLKFNGASVKTFPVPAIQPGQSATLTVTCKFACPAKITITIDTGGANIEADKANNVWEKNIC